MLTSVPAAINKATRQVVLRHPQNFTVTVSRKKVLREELDANGDPSESAGMPTLGGMGVMRSEDEAEFEYAELGEGRMLFSGPYNPQDIIEADNGVAVDNLREVQIECLAVPGSDDYWMADAGDLVMADMGVGVVIAFEVASVGSSVGIPPYTRRVFLNPRDDLNYVAPFDEV